MTLHSLVPADTDDSVIPAEIREVIALFEVGGLLADVMFPGVDTGAFDTLTSDVQASAHRVALIRRQLAEARDELQSAQQALARRAGTALAYAGVYGSADPELTGHLETLGLAKRVKQQKKTRRRRRKSAQSTASEPSERTAELPLIAVG